MSTIIHSQKCGLIMCVAVSRRSKETTGLSWGDHTRQSRNGIVIVAPLFLAIVIYSSMCVLDL